MESESDARGGGALSANAKKLCELYNSLEAKRQPWVCLWQDIATYIVPRKYPGLNGTVSSPGTENESRLFDITAIRAHQINANGCLAWMTPGESTWFSYAPPATEKDESVKMWLSKASQATREALSQSNFYLAVHEFYLDRSAFGTAALFCEPGDDEAVTFQCWGCGTFVINTDHRDKVTTVIRKFTLTAEQAAEKFGEENLSAKILKAYNMGGSAAQQEFEFLHFVMPRKKQDRQGTIKQQMPIACYYIEKDAQRLVMEDGYSEMPVLVSRYLEWGTGTGGMYGWSPAFSALPEARQVNFLQKMMDAFAEKCVFPPWLVPEDMEKEVDPNAAAVNYFSKDLQAHQMPREMPIVGKYDIGKDRVIERQNAIKEAFQVDMFQMFASMEKQHEMTAREVMERSQEKLVQFSPTFQRITTELCNPLIRWLFDTLMMQGAFGPVEEIPGALIRQVPGGLYVATPQVQYSSRIALALKQQPTIGFWRTLELATAIATAKGDPSVFDCLDVDAAVVSDAISNGVDADIIVPMNKRRAIRDARAKAMQQQEEMQQMAMGAEAAGKLGTIKSDSMIGKAVAA